MNKKYFIPFIISLPIAIIAFALSLVGIFLKYNTMCYVGLGIQAAALLVMAIVLIAVYRHNKNYPQNKVKFLDSTLSYSIIVSATSLLLLSDCLRSMMQGYDNSSDKIFDIVLLVILGACVLISWTSYFINRQSLKKIALSQKAKIIAKEDNTDNEIK